MIEIWRDIKGFEGLYQVSNLGRVKSLINDIILKPLKVYHSYLAVVLCKNGIQKRYLIHRLVAMTFPDLVDWTDEAKGLSFEEIEINHKDENPINNSVDNLQWCTHPENINWGTRTKKYTETIKQVGNYKPILQYTKDGQFVNEYSSTMEAQRQTGVCNQTICACCNGKRKSAGGYIWKHKLPVT